MPDNPMTAAMRDRIAARDALRRVLNDPRPWHDVAKGWTREQVVTRLSEIDAGLKKDGAHECPDWDFMLISPEDPEIECCTCGKK